MTQNLKNVGITLFVLGMFGIIGGILGYLYAVPTYYTWWGETYQSGYEYPLRTIGLIFLTLGIIAVIIGLVIYGLAEDFLIRDHGQKLRYQQQAATFNPQPIYCKNCSRTIPQDSKLCPYCGILQR